jgi:predicted metal-dependent phosphoesterase TrpH
MHQEKPPLHADLHFHTQHSDGLASVAVMVAAAVARKIDVIALTDHNEISGWGELEQAAQAQQAAGFPLLALLGVEVSTVQGHVLTIFPNRDLAENFSRTHVPNPQKKVALMPWAQDFIARAIDDYEAICIIAHPGFRYISGFSHFAIERLAQALPAGLQKNLGIEVGNWMTQALFWEHKAQTRQTRQLATELHLAQFASSDAHRPKDIGAHTTLLEMDELSGAAFTRAVQERRTVPEAGATNWLDSTVSCALVEATNKIGSVRLKYD